MGFRAVFVPAAVVDHEGAPHVKGRRFDYKYNFWARYNHALLLSRNFGLSSHELPSWIWSEVRHLPEGPRANLLRLTIRVVVGLCGITAGIVISLGKACWKPCDPVRRDRIGREIRQALVASAA
jgi:hypothetical protein